MDRARPRLIAALAPLVLAVFAAACTTTTGSPVNTSTATSPTRATPKPSGYPLPKGRVVEVGKGQTGTVNLVTGDTLAVHRPNAGTKPSGDALVLAEVTDSQLIYQAVAAGRATLSTDDPPPAPTCDSTPCPPGRAAPPMVTVEVTKPLGG